MTEPPTVMPVTGAELVAVAQLHLWLSVGLEEVYRAFANDDAETACILARALFEHEGLHRDLVAVDAVADRLFQLVFGYPADQRRQELRAQLLRLAEDVRAEMKAADLAGVPLGDLPS